MQASKAVCATQAEHCFDYTQQALMHMIRPSRNMTDGMPVQAAHAAVRDVLADCAQDCIDIHCTC